MVEIKTKFLQCTPCEDIVEKPRILVKDIGLKGMGSPTVCVQWYGKNDHIDDKTMQFHFPLICDPYGVQWMGHPELFVVPFLGEVKNWPEKDAVQEIADAIADGKLNSWIIWLCSHHYHSKYDEGGIGPGSFIAQVVLLGDSGVGLIKPDVITSLDLLTCEYCKK